MTTRVGALLALGVGLLGLVGAARADGPTASVRVGRVEMSKVFEKWEWYQKANKDLEGQAKAAKERIEQRQRQFPFLLPEEYNYLQTLEGRKDKLNQADRQQYERLLQLSNERDKELEGLIRLDNANKDQQRRRQDLLNIQTQAKKGIEDMVGDLQAQVNKEDAKLTELIRKMIEATCAELAKTKTLDVILNGENVLFGGIDITDDLAKALNAKPAPK